MAAAAGVNADVAIDAVPTPAELIAAAVTVYASPLVNPKIVHTIGAVKSSHGAVNGPPVPVATSWYPVIAAPPLKPGSVKETVIRPSPAEAEVMCGARGTTATTSNVRTTSEAAAYCALPPCDAVIEQVPTVNGVTVPALVTEHTDDVDVVNDTARPLEALAVNAKEGDPKSLSAIVPKVIDWFKAPTSIT